MNVRAAMWTVALVAGGASVAVWGEEVLTQDGGQPVGDNQSSRTAGPGGGVLLEDVHLVQRLARFDRERIPERVVHARGVGAHGEFVSYGDFSEYTRAALFGAEGKRTPVFVRFSTVIHPKGSPEQLRDPRGFAVKFYTEEGNWDLVGNNLPVFFIRDAIKFPDMVHSLKPSPLTNQQDPNRFFDFFSHVPESTHMLTLLYSNQGTPSNLRQMDGFGVHAFKWVDAEGDVTYVKFNWRSQQGLAPMSAADAAAAMAENHSGHTADLYEAIARGDYPAWELRVQLLRPDQLDDFDFDPLDATKVWAGVEEVPVGRMTLNRLPEHVFAETEQVAFWPGMLVPGIEPSEDRLLQGRLFSYADTQRYRLGANYLSLSINRPRVPVRTINQDGAGFHARPDSDVNYQPSVLPGTLREEPAARWSQPTLRGSVQRARIAKTANFAQAGAQYRAFSEAERDHLIRNLAGDLGRVTNRQVQLRLLSFFAQADAGFGQRLTEALGASPDDVRRMIEANAGLEPTRWRTIALEASGQPEQAVVRNETPRPVRYRVRTSASEWSPLYTLLPHRTHTYARAAVTVELEGRPGEPLTVQAGSVVDLGRVGQ